MERDITEEVKDNTIQINKNNKSTKVMFKYIEKYNKKMENNN